MDAELLALGRHAGDRLMAAGLTVATAESCTGGWIAKALTDPPGSSVWFDCGIVSYSNLSKQSLLGVQGSTIEREGAVSEAVVREMVIGLLERADADVGVAVSGIAGPDGGTDDKPVGTVWVAWATASDVESDLLDLSNEETAKIDRDWVRRQTVICALEGIDRLLHDG